MSFLLDALGKADDDRRRSEVPELRTYNQGRRSPMRAVIRGFLLLSLCLAFFTLGYFLRPALEKNLFTKGVASMSNLPAQPKEQPVERPASRQPAKMTAAENVPKAVEKAAKVEASQAFELEVISYSNSPTARFAMINGAVIHEGEMLISGETLLLIEADAVILEKAGRQIRVGL
ncbi:MAG: general secretion pathway protein GspB [Proteobacteria bacterium]|nr:general secretion pathway protein GspB [Pseudomonadota bacterium]